MQQTLSGAGYFFAGLDLITRPGLRRFVIIPILINTLLFIGLFLLLRHFVGEFNHWFYAHLPMWLHWLSGLIWLFFFLSFFIIFIYTFITVGNIISAPFNSLLAEKVEFYLTGHVRVSRTLKENLRDVPRILGRQFVILGYYLPRAFILLILFFIPVVQTFAALFWFLFNAWYLTLTYIDYPTDNHGVSIQNVRVWLKQHRWLAWSFGITVLLASMLPVVNFVVIPAAVAGATKLWMDKKSACI